jgi:acetoin:2,6-dichlorophenolindophenol oxidoreductase subunit beta
MAELMFRHAIGEALAEEMERDRNVVLLGEDIVPGGIFAVTAGLAERFDSDRVIDTPISEMAFTSAAFGAALRGLRPVVEIMFADFLPLVLDTLLNQAGKYPFFSNGQASVPLVVRTSVGAGIRFGPIHSETPTGLVLGAPGIKVVAPSNAADAKGLTKAAVRDEGPVIVFEHKLLYGRKSDVPEPLAPVEIGRAAVVRAGGDLTLVAAMAMVPTALEAATRLEESGITAEVVDLRSLRPLDKVTIVESVGRTRRVVCVEEGPPRGGYSGEVFATVLEQVPGAVACRVTMPDLPVPFSPPLEDAVLPSVDRVVSAAVELMSVSVEA